MLVKLQRPPPEIRIFLPARSARSSTATRRPRFPASEAQNSPAAPAPKTTTSNRRLIVNRHCLRFRARKCTDVVGNEQLRRHHNAFIKGGNLPMTREGKTSQELTGQRKAGKTVKTSLTSDVLALVRALWKQRRQHHQIRQAEQPLVRMRACCFCGACDESQMAALCEIVEMIDANSRETCHFRVGEDFLARFDGDHWPCSWTALVWSRVSIGFAIQTVRCWLKTKRWTFTLQ
jgi:hypothetical protein